MRRAVAAGAGAVILILFVLMLIIHIGGGLQSAPPAALLFPCGDVPGGETTKTFYITIGRSVRYATIVAFGNVTLETNTTGWYVFLAMRDVAPVGASSTLPWGHINATLRDGSVFELWNYNNTHGVVVRDTGMKHIWAAQIVKVGEVYVWHPVVADDALRDYVKTLGAPIRLYEPTLDYLAFDGAQLYIYADCFDGTWRLKSCATSIPLASFTQLAPGSTYAVDGLEQVGDVYVYWPVFAIHYVTVGGDYMTYLHVEAK
jgi:hypothetical protein